MSTRSGPRARPWWSWNASSGRSSPGGTSVVRPARSDRRAIRTTAGSTPVMTSWSCCWRRTARRRTARVGLWASCGSLPALATGSRGSTTGSAARGQAAIERALYVPRSWTEDPERCRGAGIPDGLAFATKPQLAARMVARTWTREPPPAGSRETRSTATTRTVGHRLKTDGPAMSWPCPAPTLSSPTPGSPGEGPRRADPQAGLAAPLGRCGREGRAVSRRNRGRHPQPVGSLGHWRLLVRRNRRTGELAFFCCFSPGTDGSPSRCLPTPSSPSPQPPNAVTARPSWPDSLDRQRNPALGWWQ